jgi:hypothetical protein
MVDGLWAWRLAPKRPPFAAWPWRGARRGHQPTRTGTFCGKPRAQPASGGEAWTELRLTGPERRRPGVGQRRQTGSLPRRAAPREAQRTPSGDRYPADPHRRTPPADNGGQRDERGSKREGSRVTVDTCHSPPVVLHSWGGTEGWDAREAATQEGASVPEVGESKARLTDDDRARRLG